MKALFILALLVLVTGCTSTTEYAEDICENVPVDNTRMTSACADFVIAQTFYATQGSQYSGKQRTNVRDNVVNYANFVIRIRTVQMDQEFAQVRFGRRN